MTKRCAATCFRCVLWRAVNTSKPCAGHDRKRHPHMTGDRQTGDTSGDDDQSVSLRSSCIRAARPPHADGVPDAGKLVSLNTGSFIERVFEGAPKATQNRCGGTADAFRSRCEAPRCPGTKRTRQEDGWKSWLEREEKETGKRPSAGCGQHAHCNARRRSHARCRALV